MGNRARGSKEIQPDERTNERTKQASTKERFLIALGIKSVSRSIDRSINQSINQSVYCKHHHHHHSFERAGYLGLSSPSPRTTQVQHRKHTHYRTRFRCRQRLMLFEMACTHSLPPSLPLSQSCHWQCSSLLYSWIFVVALQCLTLRTNTQKRRRH